MADFQLVLGDRDATGLVSTLAWSGSVKQCARALDLTLGVPGSDTLIPEVSIDPGVHAELWSDGALRFDGWVVSRGRDLGGRTGTVTCFDRGFYLKRNETTLAVKNQTPEAVTRGLASDFGIECGDIEETGVQLTRNFLPSSGGANSLYSIIQTLYTLASEKTGEKYFIRFEGTKLCVRRRMIQEYSLILKTGSNLLTASETVSIENLVNQVRVYDKNDKLLTTRTADDLLAAYGILQAVVTAREGDDPDKLASEKLEDNGIRQDLTVTNLGGLDCLAGGTVYVREPGSGLNGVFWIDEDKHIWRKGIYTNQLVLNYRSTMAEVTAGGEPKQ